MTVGTNLKKKPAQTFSAPPYNEHRAKILYDATIQFCAQQGRKKIDGAEEYKTLFYSFINDVDHKTKKLISSHLARNRATPRSIAYYLALETIEIAAPFLLMSHVFWERDIMQLINKLTNSHLLILARRSDITPTIAGALIARGDNLINQVLSKNPTLRLNRVAQGGNVTPAYEYSDEQSAPEFPAELSKKPANELLELAQIALTGKKKPGKNPVADRMIAHAEAQHRSMVAREIADHIGMNLQQVEKIVGHDSCESLVIFLKGMDLSQNEVSQLLVKLNSKVARNVSVLNKYMEQYDKFTASQCRDIMRNLGARGLNSMASRQQPPMPDGNALNNAISQRQRQVSMVSEPALFGSQRQSA